MSLLAHSAAALSLQQSVGAYTSNWSSIISLPRSPSACTSLDRDALLWSGDISLDSCLPACLGRSDWQLLTVCRAAERLNSHFVCIIPLQNAAWLSSCGLKLCRAKMLRASVHMPCIALLCAYVTTAS